MPFTIWCDRNFSEPAIRLLVESARPHSIVWAPGEASPARGAAARDPVFERADIAFGQPDPAACLASKHVRWVEVTSAGYTPYDTPEFRETFHAEGRVFTNMSQVFADACAQHVLAMMLALNRRLLESHRDQLNEQSWDSMPRRGRSKLLTGETVLLLGYGAIGRRLADLLVPFGMKVMAVRRQVRSERGVRIIPEAAVSSALAEADHVVNILPDNDATRGYVNARRLGCCKRGARFYNVGRGTTVDTRALVDALRDGRIAEAYLDVFPTEPLPPGDPLWTTPHVYFTPHTAGGRADHDTAIVKHFLANLTAFERREPMVDRIV